jgi:FkbM family methyltransferase
MPNSLVRWAKDYLVKLGPNNVLVQSALRMHGLRSGYGVTFAKDTITILRDKRKMILNKAEYVQVPIMMECYDLFFNSIASTEIGGTDVLDFSKPGLQRYRKNGESFYFPAIPEDDVIDAYVHSYAPKAGDIVWDAGAYAGASTYFFAEMVGPSGKVYAFEPDLNNYQYLLKNIELHKMTNVIPIRKALSGSTGTAEFEMNGSMSSALSDFIAYSENRTVQKVETLTFEDACTELGGAPNYVKMDIEGAEVAMVQSSLEFLKANPVHFAIESYHRVDGELTFGPLEKLFASIGYQVWSSDQYGQMFTWAKPVAK